MNEKYKPFFSGNKYKANFNNKEIRCPICNNDQFYYKSHTIANALLQALDLEGFGEAGVMLICDNCSYVQTFANEKVVTLLEQNESTEK